VSLACKDFKSIKALWFYYVKPQAKEGGAFDQAVNSFRLRLLLFPMRYCCAAKAFLQEGAAGASRRRILRIPRLRRI